MGPEAPYEIRDVVVKTKLKKPFISIQKIMDKILGLENFIPTIYAGKSALLYRVRNYFVYFFEDGSVVGSGSCEDVNEAKGIVNKAVSLLFDRIPDLRTPPPEVDVTDIEVAQTIEVDLNLLLSENLRDKLKEIAEERARVTAIEINVIEPRGKLRLESLETIIPAIKEVEKKLVLISCRSGEIEAAKEILESFRKILLE